MKNTSVNTYARAFSANENIKNAAGNYKSSAPIQIAKVMLGILTLGIGYGVMHLIEKHTSKEKVREFCDNARDIFDALTAKENEGKKNITVVIQGKAITLTEVNSNENPDSNGVLVSDEHNNTALCKGETFKSIEAKLLQDSISNPGVYGRQFLTYIDKIDEEDRVAFDTLTSVETKNFVSGFAEKTANHLEGLDELEKTSLLSAYKNIMLRSKQSYPIPREIENIKTINDLCDILRKNESTPVTLGLIWPIFSNSHNGDKMKEIDDIYKEKIAPTKDYKQQKHANLPKEERFGNGKKIKSDIFSDRNFYPYIRDVDYKVFNEKTKSETNKEMQKNAIPYVSGLSGMANLSCKVLSQLNIKPNSKEWTNFTGAMSSFIVGSGMHSYYEVKEAFAFYEKKLTKNVYNINFV